jgi:hypothetical protein
MCLVSLTYRSTDPPTSRCHNVLLIPPPICLWLCGAQWCRDICGGLDLEWLLHIPIHRPTQYKVIFTELIENASVSSAIISHIPKSHKSLSLSRCGILEELSLTVALKGLDELCELMDDKIVGHSHRMAEQTESKERVVSDVEGLNLVVIGDSGDERPKTSLITALLQQNNRSEQVFVKGLPMPLPTPTPRCGFPILAMYLSSEYSAIGDRGMCDRGEDYRMPIALYTHTKPNQHTPNQHTPNQHNCLLVMPSLPPHRGICSAVGYNRNGGVSTYPRVGLHSCRCICIDIFHLAARSIQASSDQGLLSHAISSHNALELTCCSLLSDVQLWLLRLGLG